MSSAAHAAEATTTLALEERSKLTLSFVGALVTSGAVWMIGPDRIQVVAAYDGAFVPFFGVFNRRLGTPVRVRRESVTAEIGGDVQDALAQVAG